MVAFKSQVEDAVMARGGKKRGAEIRFRCVSHDDEHPSADYNPQKGVWICRACRESGNYWHLGLLLGVINNGHRPDGWQETRRWTIGEATHKRLEKAGNKKRVIWEGEGAPIIHLGPSESCFDLEALLKPSQPGPDICRQLTNGFQAKGSSWVAKWGTYDV